MVTATLTYEIKHHCQKNARLLFVIESCFGDFKYFLNRTKALISAKMTKTVRGLLQNVRSFDETDRMPDKISVTNLDIIMYVVAIVGHFVDLGLDINVAVRYSLARKMTEFGWTLAFILIPAFVNTAVSIRMYVSLFDHNRIRCD